ncbi:alpha/beta hydrolase family protein [Hoeflea poritis]|uniref:Alpha/beta fold hydrolase n=1 Tax=Hoeflea poritis TaxID=2993659 RepID=A0ABT4VI00_9HYPH|nr:alpha/beta fold hydrolase [Hoeflea poritis]MDA4844316.1 alpha/beta fold hydrolase [Hoeflea poritis]
MNINAQTSENKEITAKNALKPLIADEDIEARDVRFTASDGYILTGTLFTAKAGQPHNNGPLVLVSSATGAPRGFYRSFARELVAHGSRGVLTYDYRGLPDSPRPQGFEGRINMRDWAHRDMPAAIRRLDEEAPGHAMVGIGQSFGGQALGICGRPERFQRYCMVATLSGYWRNTSTAWQNLVMMHVIGLPMTALLGRTARWMGLGEPIPATVFRDWARWCFHHEYFFDDPTVGAREGYARVRMPILSLGMTDDPWGTPKAIHALMKHYVNADITERWLTPENAGGQPIGHLGFFRSRFRDTLWPSTVSWLLEGPEPPTRP